MYKVIREINFSYGHRLMNYEGKCKYLHGHNGRVLLELSSETLDDQNMVMDFYDIKTTMEAWINETIDHRMILWDQDPLVKDLEAAGQKLALMKENPTAEAIAKWIFDEAKAKNLPVSKVTLWETPDSAAEYAEN